MRIRSVKPDFWRDDVTGFMRPDVALFYVGLSCFADDDGRFEWSAALIRADLDPYDTKWGGVDGIERQLSELLRLRRIRQYESDGKKYGHIPTQKRHQHPKRPTTRCPSPPQVPNEDGTCTEHVPTSGVPEAEAEAEAEVEVEAEQQSDAPPARPEPVADDKPTAIRVIDDNPNAAPSRWPLLFGFRRALADRLANTSPRSWTFPGDPAESDRYEARLGAVTIGVAVEHCATRHLDRNERPRRVSSLLYFLRMLDDEAPAAGTAAATGARGLAGQRWAPNMRTGDHDKPENQPEKF